MIIHARHVCSYYQFCFVLYTLIFMYIVDKILEIQSVLIFFSLRAQESAWIGEFFLLETYCLYDVKETSWKKNLYFSDEAKAHVCLPWAGFIVYLPWYYCWSHLRINSRHDYDKLLSVINVKVVESYSIPVVFTTRRGQSPPIFLNISHRIRSSTSAIGERLYWSQPIQKTKTTHDHGLSLLKSVP